MTTEILDSLRSVAPAAWNRVAASGNPFVQHEFLAALERTGCVGGATGWRPQHIVSRDAAGTIAGAVPLYIKDHSYGEYVFDWAWAGAYARAGEAYYPKLVAAVPFTPVTGPRLLVADGPDKAAVTRDLIETVRRLAEDISASSVHWLFTSAADTNQLSSHDLLRRVGYQFHWTNRGYRDFDDFLATFTADKRKKLKRERRYVRDASVRMEIVTARAATAAHWDTLYSFYRATLQAHGGAPYLTRGFFHELGVSLPEQTLIVFGRHGNDYVSGALFLRGHDTLYGRYWGGRPEYHSLHFETCYYTAIEYCIAHGLARFEAGAQGDHKLARGLTPTPTYSAHWIAHPQFRRAIADFIAREANGIAHYMDEINEHAPFKQSTPNMPSAGAINPGA